jgi:hypothetical protein
MGYYVGCASGTADSATAAAAVSGFGFFCVSYIPTRPHAPLASSSILSDRARQGPLLRFCVVVGGLCFRDSLFYVVLFCTGCRAQGERIPQGPSGLS